MKDLSEEVVEELTSRHQSDPVALKRFYQSFGLDPEELYAKGFQTIAEIFPGTPIKTLRDVFKALRLLDLVDLLENVTNIARNRGHFAPVINCQRNLVFKMGRYFK